MSEAIGIARSLGIRKPATPSSLREPDHDSSSTFVRTEINSQQIPLYFLGVEALEAEKAILSQRKSDDFTEIRVAQIVKELQILEANRQIEVLNERKNEDIFLRDVEPLRAEEARLRNLNLDLSRLKLVTIDRSALEPLAPVKPRKMVILLLGIFLGIMAGIGVAIVRYFLMIKNEGLNYRVTSVPEAIPNSTQSTSSPGYLEREN